MDGVETVRSLSELYGGINLPLRVDCANQAHITFSRGHGDLKAIQDRVSLQSLLDVFRYIGIGHVGGVRGGSLYPFEIPRGFVAGRQQRNGNQSDA
ncbi:hypothetical protein GCM10011533_27720 [Streptosporangium jomthongense]|nr:hypothetical protein GCM10011533_27720 [Streptosporangium jomthongense]